MRIIIVSAAVLLSTAALAENAPPAPPPASVMLTEAEISALAEAWRAEGASAVTAARARPLLDKINATLHPASPK
jgi:hypothetical protein